MIKTSMKYGRKHLHLGRVTISASRWPWQVRTSPRAWLSTDPKGNAGNKFGWKPTDGMGRFGGGWNWKLGIDVARTSLILNLIFGMVHISWRKPDAGL